MQRASEATRGTARGPDTDPIDLRDLHRAAPRRAEMVEPFAGGHPPRLAPDRSATVTVFGAPIPAAGVKDPAPLRRTPRGSLVVVRDNVSYGWRTRWAPSRRRRLTHLTAVIVLVFSVALVLAAAISILAG